jgi:hypothetical protein
VPAVFSKVVGTEMFAEMPIIYGMLVSLVGFAVVRLLTLRSFEERMRAWE